MLKNWKNKQCYDDEDDEGGGRPLKIQKVMKVDDVVVRLGVRRMITEEENEATKNMSTPWDLLSPQVLELIIKTIQQFQFDYDGVCSSSSKSGDDDDDDDDVVVLIQLELGGGGGGATVPRFPITIQRDAATHN